MIIDKDAVYQINRLEKELKKPTEDQDPILIKRLRGEIQRNREWYRNKRRGKS